MCLETECFRPSRMIGVDEATPTLPAGKAVPMRRTRLRTYSPSPKCQERWGLWLFYAGFAGFDGMIESGPERVRTVLGEPDAARLGNLRTTSHDAEKLPGGTGGTAGGTDLRRRSRGL